MALTEDSEVQMAHVITFRSSKFDPGMETPNPINPIAGESVLLWLCAQLKDSPYRATTPAAEDWGWYLDVSGAGAAYLVGASADADERGAVDWTIQIHERRSLTDKLMGARKMTADDPLSALVERILRADPDIGEVDCTRAPSPVASQPRQPTSNGRDQICFESNGDWRRSRCFRCRRRSWLRAAANRPHHLLEFRRAAAIPCGQGASSFP